MSSGAWIVLGGAVGAIGAILGGFVERASRGRGELVSAAASWLSAVEALSNIAQQDAQLSTPPTNRVGSWLEWFTDQAEATLGKGRVDVMRSLVQRPLLKRVESVAERVWESTYILILRAPRPLLLELQPHLVALDAWLKAPMDPALKARWEDQSRPAVIQAIRKRTQPAWRRYSLTRLLGR